MTHNDKELSTQQRNQIRADAPRLPGDLTPRGCRYRSQHRIRRQTHHHSGQLCASKVRSIFRFSMTVSSLFQPKRSSVGKLMPFGRHRQIDNRVRTMKMKRFLQRNNQDVENGPRQYSESTVTTTRQQTSNREWKISSPAYTCCRTVAAIERNRFGQQTYPQGLS